jgi:hypothetical protein
VDIAAAALNVVLPLAEIASQPVMVKVLVLSVHVSFKFIVDPKAVLKTMLPVNV